VLCTCVPGYGHLHPLVPLALALQAAGHQVAFATEERFCDRVERAGFRAFPAGLGPGKVLAQTSALLGDAGHGDNARFGAHMFAGVAGPAKVPDLVRVIDRWPPDLLVHDVTDFAGPVAAAYAGVPTVAHSLGPMFPLDLYRFGAELIAPTWETWGVDPPGPFAGMFGAAYLDICPPSLQSADLAAAGANVIPLRPVPFDAVAGEDLPESVGDLEDDTTIYVTLGTLDNDAPGILEAAVAGLREEPYNVIVTVGPNRDPAEFGPQPDNVCIERYLPQSLVLPVCHAVVAHGGSGTMLAALSHGLPLLLLPQGANQFENAERCATAGAAIRLLPGEVSPLAVRVAVRALLEEPGFRQRAGEIAAEIAARPRPAAIVPDIVDIAGATTTRR